MSIWYLTGQQRTCRKPGRNGKQPQKRWSRLFVKGSARNPNNLWFCRADEMNQESIGVETDEEAQTSVSKYDALFKQV